MQALTSDDVEKMLVKQVKSEGRPPPGFPERLEIPSARYYDPEFARLEMEHLWLKVWLMTGSVSELREPGSYRLFERLGKSVIIMRGKDGNIHAFHNSCRHRGSPLLLDQQGRAPRMVCPYHGWTYGDDGRLLALREPQEFPCLEKNEMGLLPVRCEVWNGLIFINFDPDARPFDEFVSPLAELAAAFPFDRFEVKARHVYEIECNWKVGVDNVLEIYHVYQLHARSIAEFLDGPTFTVGLRGNGHSQLFTRKKVNNISAPGEILENVAGQMFEDYNICMNLFPNNIYLFDTPGFIYHNYWPTGPGSCLVEYTQCGVETRDAEYYLDIFKAAKPVLDEDWDMFPHMQRALQTGASQSMTLGYQERGIYWMHQEIDRRIGPDRIPEHLRVPHVLKLETA